MKAETFKTGILFVFLTIFASTATSASVSGTQLEHQPITVDFTGPAANESDSQPNPFLDYRIDVNFQAPSGTTYKVPGFFAGDGIGGGTGNTWRVRFTPDEAGEWTYNAVFMEGEHAAVSNSTDELNVVSLPEAEGVFNIQSADETAPGFLGKGRLLYKSEHYLQFKNGERWIKGGVDSPENFFGFAGFDNTVNQEGGVGEAQMINGLHHYTEHVADWQEGDPLFMSSSSGVDSKGLIGAINYLSDRGVNSMYFLLMNLGGDGRDTYPFIEATGTAEANTHYDISKLAQWNTAMLHMQRKGIAAHLVLGEQEEGNQLWLDEGELGIERKLFYREMVARFSHLNAIKWNLSEESRYGDAKHLAFGAELAALDWANHPVAVHSFVDHPEKAYNALLGKAPFTSTSIQFHAENADEFTESWRKKSADAGRPWVIDMDEVGPGNTGLTEDNADELRKSVLYPVYFSGGNIEWYFGHLAADIRTEDFRSREPMLNYMRYAREFMLAHLPFWEMEPADDLLSGGDANDQVFEKPGDTYSVYLNRGDNITSLNVVEGDYSLRWFNPRTGEFVAQAEQRSGDIVEIGVSPADASEDWVVLIKRERAEIESPDSEPETTSETDSDNNPQVDSEATDPTVENSEPDLGQANSADSGSAGLLFLLMMIFSVLAKTIAGFQALVRSAWLPLRAGHTRHRS